MNIPTSINTNTSGISALLLIFVIAFLFWKLKNVSWYLVAIYSFLFAFWFAMTIARTSVNLGDRSSLPIWAWPLIVGSYQLVQAITRIPLGILSAKIRSRQIPILITSSTILFSVIAMVATNFALWTIVFATVATGFFGATYGLQNQYWSENYDKRATFITVALIAILPSLAFLSSSYLKNTIVINFNSNNIKWLLVAIVGFLALTMILNVIFKEHRETILLDNKSHNHKHVTNMKFKHVLSLSVSVILISLSYNMVNTATGSQQDMINGKTNFESIVITIIAIVIALLTALYIIHRVKAFNLIIIGHLLQIIGFLLALIYYFETPAKELKWAYLIIMVIGFTIFQNTLLGVTLHFDHKNTILVLGIWLSFRSAATGFGQIIGKETVVHSHESIKWLVVAATVLTIISTIYASYRYLTHHKKLFILVDQYERNSWNTSWKSAKHHIVAK